MVLFACVAPIPRTPPAAQSTPSPAPAPSAPAVGKNTKLHGSSFEYSFQRDAYADQEFTNDVGD